jgi:hypothetical protein
MTQVKNITEMMRKPEWKKTVFINITKDNPEKNLNLFEVELYDEKERKTATYSVFLKTPEERSELLEKLERFSERDLGIENNNLKIQPDNAVLKKPTEESKRDHLNKTNKSQLYPIIKAKLFNFKILDKDSVSNDLDKNPVLKICFFDFKDDKKTPDTISHKTFRFLDEVDRESFVPDVLLEVRKKFVDKNFKTHELKFNESDIDTKLITQKEITLESSIHDDGFTHYANSFNIIKNPENDSFQCRILLKKFDDSKGCFKTRPMTISKPTRDELKEYIKNEIIDKLEPQQNINLGRNYAGKFHSDTTSRGR